MTLAGSVVESFQLMPMPYVGSQVATSFVPVSPVDADTLVGVILEGFRSAVQVRTADIFLEAE